MKQPPKKIRVLCWSSALSILLVGVMAVALLVGYVSLVEPAISSLKGDSLGSFYKMILWDIRLPRVLLATSYGGAMGVAGVIFQAVFRNPLADPFLLGVSSGGAFGAIVAVMVGDMDGAFTVPYLPMVFSFIGSSMALLAVMGVGALSRRNDILVLLLAGILLSLLLSSLTMFFLTTSEPAKVAYSLTWLVGDLSRSTLKMSLGVCGVTVAVTVVFLQFAKGLNQVSFGAELAQLMGINPKWLIIFLLTVSSLLMGLHIAVAGTIGFVGLIVPNAARLLFGSDHRMLLPTSFLMGALLVTLSDVVSRLILTPQELPVGIVTSMVGAPIFIGILVGMSRHSRSWEV